MPPASKSRTGSHSSDPVLHVLGAHTEVVGDQVHCTVSTHSRPRMTLAFSGQFATETGKDLALAGRRIPRRAAQLLKPGRRVG